MNCRAAYEQQEEARWRVFLMFVAMAVQVIRTGLVSRGVIAILPVENARLAVVPAANHQPASTSPVDVRQATLVLLCLAEAAGQLFILKERTIWELMNRPPARPAQERSFDAADLCGRPAERLDTS